MKQMNVGYWAYGSKMKGMDIEHNTMMDYSEEKKNEIIDKALENGYQVMLQKKENDILMIWIDDKRFRQR